MSFTKLIVLLLLPFLAQAQNPDNYYPVTVSNCTENITFDKMPSRALVNDLNMVQMALALGLQPQMVAVSGISAWYKTSDEFKQSLGDIPEISKRYLSLEPLLSIQPDFVFAGWNYGLRLGTELTPENFARFGIQTLILGESCAHVNKDMPTASMNLLYNDILRLGKIFNKNQHAQQLVGSWQQQLASINQKIEHLPKKRVFLYDSGIDKPFTSGRLAMPEALISAAGGVNIMNDSDFSWRTTSWEQVAIDDPELIILVDYQTNGALGTEELKQTLKNHPLMRETQAIKNDQYLLLKYGEITPGPENIDAVKKIARSLYPSINF